MKTTVCFFLFCLSHVFSSEVVVPTDFEKIDFFCYHLLKTLRSVECGVTVHLSCKYPSFVERNNLTDHIEPVIKEHIRDLENDFVHEITDRYNRGEFDEYYDGPTRNLEYILSPTCYTENLISLYGSCFRYYASPHGCIRHEGKTFWKKDGLIRELVLEDLFIPKSGYDNFIIDYCTEKLKTCSVGYYHHDSGILPEINRSDIETFILAKEGLAIIFQPFVVGTWTEGPDYVIIPYETLKPFIRLGGPLKEVWNPPASLSLYARIKKIFFSF